jgi:3-oxoacyl-[acyl-carrier-protein] synthase II
MHAVKPVIVGYDAVSPLGTDLEVQWQRALRAESGIGQLTRFPLRQGFPVRIAGQVAEINGDAYPFLSPRAMAQWTSPLFKHALLVVHRALQKSGIEITADLSPRVGITFGSAIGGLDAVIAADRQLTARGKMPPPFTNPNSCINMVSGKISMLSGATGPIAATVTACATGSTSLIVGAMMIEQGMADVVICGAVDFPLVEPIIAGFATMNGAYRPKEGRPNPSPQKASCPFSIERRGFVVSEGAGCLLLASRAFAQTRGIPFHIEMAGWSMTADAHHFVAPNLETVRRCISESINRAALTPGNIDAINAHGTSTRIGDKVEADALRDVFGDTIPPVSANKSQIGHAMGASSAIETIFALEGMIQERALPTINYMPDPAIEMDCVPEGARTLRQEHVLKNAFGFGGCNSCIVFRRIR